MTAVLQRMLAGVAEAVDAARPAVSGRVAEVRGLSIRVTGVQARVGDLVRIGEDTFAEVVAVQLTAEGRVSTCLPLGALTGIGAGDPVVSTGAPMSVRVGDELLGQVLDGLGRPLDGSRLPTGMARVGLDGTPPDALTRDRVDVPMPTGVRAIDTLTPVGRGQRLGIFAGSGVGKSSLLSMLTRGTSADVTVLALIGERGREVREFLEDDLGPEGLRNAVVVVATSDQPPMVRLRAAFVATRIAEFFRDGGKDVLLMMDSVTRLAIAQREIGLSAGEPPTTRGFPPSVFALLPQLLERAGAAATGSITGLYTVLVDGDDHNEPIADTVRSILDGHLVLERSLANAGHFPAVDVLQSVSRVAGAVTTAPQREVLREARRLIAARRDVKPLVEIGAYVAGTNPDADRALAAWPAIEGFLRQDLHDLTPSAQSWDALARAIGGAA
ncbi:flagellum-specific ATP synthase [Jatrophihabitans endophyticus]|uniref:Flagellum-specific ATP synthase n=1 Tax=Jatrophihabitans endophyticus TaxID=1206085 RepID=A0A1M5IGF4_9ACTN|nr:FliI/YscN family ATPase [Jatrophihabitans endophyticus]SHG27030.1 flagellum-specific ATP synthase [Jatrophihabitans endophyticus]